jgi:quercetin dioxygenase-like cupin family protein
MTSTILISPVLSSFLHGRVRLTGSQAHWDGSPGDHIVVPRARHGLHAIDDSVVLLTVAKAVGPHV